MSKEEVPDVAPRYWELVDQAGGNPKEMERILYDLSREDLDRFYVESLSAENQLWWKVEKLHGKGWADAPCWGFLDKDIVGCLISRGRKFYEEVFADPRKVLRLTRDEYDDNANYAGLAYVVYETRFDDDLEGDWSKMWPRS